MRDSEYYSKLKGLFDSKIFSHAVISNIEFQDFEVHKKFRQ